LLGHNSCQAIPRTLAYRWCRNMRTSSATRIESAPFAPFCLGAAVNINNVLPGLDAIYTDLHSRPELEGRSARRGLSKVKAAPPARPFKPPNQFRLRNWIFAGLNNPFF
jgi:hypothetical protein